MGKNKQTIQLHTESIKGLLDNLQLEYGYVSDDNIFKILNIEDKEIFHSRFLKYLISGNWDSFIGFLKYKQILDENADENKDENKNENQLLSSQCEFFCPALQDCPESKNGRIDLYFEDRNHIVAIEVKWHAGEQPMQLLRYHQYLNKLRGQTPHTLIFLTPTKRTAQKISCNKCDENCSLTKSDYKLLSFQDLNDWLSKNLTGEDPTGLISQYSEILMRETKNMSNADTILESIKDKNKFAVACAFADSMGEVKQKIRVAFFNAIKNQLKNSCYILSGPTKGKIYEIITPKDSAGSLNYYIAYDTNLYCQKGDNWWYIKPDWFTTNEFDASPTSDTEKGTAPKDKIDIAGLSGENNSVVKWYFMKEDNKDKASMIEQVTKNILKQLGLEFGLE